MNTFMFRDKKTQRKKQNAPAVIVLRLQLHPISIQTTLIMLSRSSHEFICAYIHIFFPIWGKRKHKVCSKIMFPLPDGTKSVSRLGLSLLVLQA